MEKKLEGIEMDRKNERVRLCTQVSEVEIRATVLQNQVRRHLHGHLCMDST